MKQRSSNFELMRILLMCVIPVYHLLVYNLLLKPPYSPVTLTAMIFCVGGAIPADYAFMALSSYFFLNSRPRSVLKKFLTTLSLMGTLYIVRFVIIRSLFGYNNQEFFMVEGYITQGAWWYINVYLLMQLIYPFLNMIIEHIGKFVHVLILVLLFALFALSFLRNEMHFACDIIAFLFVYFFMGYLRRSDYRRMLLIPTKKFPMLLCAVLCYCILFSIAFYSKAVRPDIQIDVVQYIISRYDVLGCFMGIFIFFFFRALSMRYHKVINWLARSTVFVFLLHETVLGVCWYLGYCWFPIWGCDVPQLLLTIVLFTVLSFLVAIAARYLYEATFQRLWAKVIDLLCRTKIIQVFDRLLLFRRGSGKDSEKPSR